MYSVKTTAAFDSAHFLKDYSGKCANLHGHTWTVEVTAGSEVLTEKGEKRGMVMDFSDLKSAVRALAKRFDHTLIYERGSLQPNTLNALRGEGFSLTEVPFRPTAENLARCFYHTLAQTLPVKRVAVFETPANCAVYEED